MDSDQTGTGLSDQYKEQLGELAQGQLAEQPSGQSEGQDNGLKKSRSLMAGLALVSFLGLAFCALILTAVALLEAPQGLKNAVTVCLSASSVGLFYFLSASFFFDLFCTFFKLEKLRILRLAGRLLLWLSSLIPLGLTWAVLRIMRGFKA